MKKNKVKLYILGTAVLGVCVAVLAMVYVQTPKTFEEKVLYATRLGGDYLVRSQYEDGSYMYEYSPTEDEVLGGYNMLRHSGTTYALLELYQETGEETYLRASEKAIDFLVTTIAPCPEPLASSSCAYDGEKTKLGGNALAILALLKHVEVTEDDAYLDTAVDLAMWMKNTQTEEGEFLVHIQYRNGDLDDHVSGYYPGEAVYALMRLYEATGDEAWLTVSEKATTWLIDVRDREETSDTITHDHWLLYGLRELYIQTHSEKYLEHAKKIVDGIMASQHKTGVPVLWVGGYYNPPRSTPTATRSEGLGAAYELFLEAEESEYAQQVYQALKSGVEFQLRTFIDGPTARTTYPNSVKALGGFRYSLEDSTVRIDYVQHNISSLLMYHRFSEK